MSGMISPYLRTRWSPYDRSFVRPLEAARHHLDEARRCLERNQRGVAASEAYYATYHVLAHAAEARGDTPLKTHEGMEWYFFHELVRAGPVTLDDHKTYFDDARAARLHWHYKGKSPEDGVSTYVEAADKLIAYYG